MHPDPTLPSTECTTRLTHISRVEPRGSSGGDLDYAYSENILR